MNKHRHNIIVIFIISFYSTFAQPYTYDYEYNDGAGNRTRLLSTYGCNTFCGCPEDRDTWFTLSSTVGGAGSNCPNGCEVTHSLNIPSEYDCYSHYKVKVNNILSSLHQLSGSQLTSIPNCIPKDDPITVTLYLYRSPDDPNPCVITKTTGCDIDCCDYIEVSFIPDGTDGSNCVFIPSVKSRDNALCNIDTDIEVKFYKYENGQWNWMPNPYYANSISIDPTSIDPSVGTTAIGYEIYFNGVLCRAMEFIEVECDCACPPNTIKEKWLKVETDPDDPACAPGQCKVKAYVDIGPANDNDCYTEYTYQLIKFDKDGNVINTDENTQKQLLNQSGDIDPINMPCLNPGESVQIKVSLYMTGSSQACVITKSAESCPLVNTDNENACDLTTEIPNSGGGGVTRVTINGCEYEVTYKYYKTTDNYQNIELTSMTPIDPNCDGANLESLVYQSALTRAITDILADEEEYLPNGEVNCFDFWRVIHKSCWSRWEMVSYDSSQTISYIPCESECCGRKLRVCKYTDPHERVVVEDLGFAMGSSNYNCSQSATVPDYPTWPINISIGGEPQDCFDLDCDVFKDIDIDIDVNDISDNEEQFDIDFNSNPVNKIINSEKENFNSILFRVYVIENAELVINVNGSNNNELRISIFNLSGQVIGGDVYNLIDRNNILRYNISDYVSGTYLYSISLDGLDIKFGKFQIVK